MPQWLSNQLMRAFHKKDRRQIRLLNECWFFYRNRPGAHDGISNDSSL
ncbi:cortex morphogenetic protein CmpA [Paenibacillus sp. Marseille-Q4541]|nr:cortex morphogenetic protein CmpA [Paenibacillus sp. Marseille-Q4541]